MSSLTICVYGMDKQLCNATEICLREGSIFDVDGKVDLIVVGKRQQKMLQGTRVVPARSKYSNDKIVYVKHDSGSYVHKKEMKSMVWRVAEPQIVRHSYYDEGTGKEGNCAIYTRKQCSYPDCVWSKVLFFGAQALEEALKDVSLYYRKILTEGLHKIGKKRSIAISALNIELNAKFGLSYKEVAAVVVKEISDFVKKHSDEYSRIELFLKERCEFDEYDRLLSLAEFVNAEQNKPNFNLWKSVS